MAYVYLQGDADRVHYEEGSLKSLSEEGSSALASSAPWQSSLCDALFLGHSAEGFPISFQSVSYFVPMEQILSSFYKLEVESQTKNGRGRM